MILETNRLILRPWEESDAEECYKYAKDPLVGPICGWIPHVNVAESKRIIKNVLSVPETYALIWKETNLPIGNIALKMGTDTDLTEKEGAYYDGNEKSKRVQEKCGFQYQWTTQDVDVPLLQEKRTGHVNCLTKKEWDRRK